MEAYQVKMNYLSGLWEVVVTETGDSVYECGDYAEAVAKADSLNAI